jgi:hypothetical protein
MSGRATAGSGSGARLRWALALSACAYFLVHVLAIFRESMNWDEFALLYRVERLTATGQIQGGGRPGLVELMLAPLVRGCQDAVVTLQHARILVAVVLLLAVAGLFELVRRARVDRPHPARGAVLAIALLVLAVPFQRWSLQVRTDQFGIAFGIWGCVALLAPRKRGRWSFTGGACLCLGFLCTQKVVYIAILGALFRVERELSSARSDRRAMLRELMACAAGAGLVFAGYRLLLPLFVGVPKQPELSVLLDVFSDYRRTFGLSLHRGLILALVPHCLIVLLAVATFRRPQRRLWFAWSALAAMVIIASFHTAMFPYFWMTLGLFPASALGYVAEELAEVLPERIRGFVIVAWAAFLCLPAALYCATLLHDSQRVQRDALQFIAREFAADAGGFQLEGALACRHEADPFPIYFRGHIERDFRGPDAPRRIETFIRRFQSRPVRFLIDSHMIGFFPEPILRFWRDNYQPYRGPVRVVGRALTDASTADWDVFAPGAYRWDALDSARQAVVEVDGQLLRDRQTVALASKRYTLRARGGEGRIVLAVGAPPVPSNQPFYDDAAIREIIGRGYFSP